MDKYFKITTRTRGIPIHYGLEKLTNLELINPELLAKLDIFKEISPNHYIRQDFIDGKFVQSRIENDVKEILGDLDIEVVKSQIHKKNGLR